jgi:hypothetical protein
VPIVLSALDPGQVSSASSFEVLVGEQAQRLLILSGIAIPEFWTNHDEETKQDVVVVKLGVHVAVLDRATAHVGLASIANDETNFLFALTGPQVEVEPGTGELLLRVPAAILGEKTLIHRFGYQVVAHVRKVSARISGTIRVPRDILDIGGFPAASVASLFEITANKVELIVPPPGQVGFTTEKLIPVAAGSTGAVRADDSAHFVDYAIDACPFNTPLRVEVKPAGGLAIAAVVAGQVAGPRPVVLTNLQPDASGVDFSVGRLPAIR